MAIRNDAIIVAFRGTEPTSLADWAAGFRTAQVPFDAVAHLSGWGRVHGGVARSLGTVLPRIVEAISRHDGAAHSLWITGHSLGGALALLAGAVLAKQERHPIAGVITFGQPLGGRSQFAARYSLALGDRTFRCVNDQDIVPTCAAPNAVGDRAPPGQRRAARARRAGRSRRDIRALRAVAASVAGGWCHGECGGGAGSRAGASGAGPLAAEPSPGSASAPRAVSGTVEGSRPHSPEFLTGYVDRLERLASD